jgi:5-methylcytosine-specific restriction enzyme subunit McrC
MFAVSEFGTIYRGDTDAILPDGDLQLSAAHFNDVLSLLEADDADAGHQAVFSYLRPKGREQLRVQNYVGVIRLPDGLQIEVLPKISKRLEAGKARQLLVKMLIELADSPFIEGTIADLEAHKTPLFELLMRCYLEQVTAIVRKGIARDYVAREDNLVFLRGKLSISEHIRRNSRNSSRVYCVYDEFDIDRPINRLIKGALLIVSRTTQDPENQQRCRELLFWFDQVPATTDSRADFQRMRQDRLVQHYAPAMPLCRLILNQLNPLTTQGESRVVSMLFPMESVFESYVAAKLPHQLREWRVSTKMREQALVDEHERRPMFFLEPDLVLSKGDTRVIADTKWKLIDEADRGGKYGISQFDLYQLFGYAQKYLRSQQAKEVVLIYPACDTFRKPLAPFWYERGLNVLYVVPYDLESETAFLPDTSLLARRGVLAPFS